MSRVIGDHPDIARVLRDGVDCNCKYRCPVCGEDLAYDAKVYMNWREVIGCEHCIETKDAGDVWEDEE